MFLFLPSGPVQHFYSSILDAWRYCVFAKLSERKGFWELSLLIFKALLQLLTSSHLRERDKMLLRAILCGVFGTDSFLARPRRKMFPVVFCGKRDGDGHLFWECTFLHLLHVRDLPEFATLMSLRPQQLARCLLWHGWLPGLNCVGERDPWAASFGDLACCKLESRLGAYPSDASAFWAPPEYWDADDIALEMSDTPNIWTDGSREDFSAIGGFEVAGAGVYVPASELAFDGSVLPVRSANCPAC